MTLLCAKFPPFLSFAPSLTWPRNGLLVFDILDRGGIVTVVIFFLCLIFLIRVASIVLAFERDWMNVFAN